MKKSFVHLHLQVGITLIEVLISLVIIAIGLLGIMQFTWQMWYHNNLIKQQIEAISVCQKKMEKLRSYEVLTTTPGWAAYADITSSVISENTTSNNTIYSTTWTVTDYTNPAYKTVTVTTGWTDIRGNAQSVTLSSIIAQIDPVSAGKVMSSAISVGL